MSQTSSTPAVPASIHMETAQTRIDEIRAMRTVIPNFTVPGTKADEQRVHATASLPPEFVELAASAIANSGDLRRENTDPNRARDLLDYADAYGPVADELESTAHFLRHSIKVARSEAGSEALATYALAKVLVRRPAMGDLVPRVEDMRRALGVQARLAKGRAARRKAAAAAGEKKDGAVPAPAPPPVTAPDKR